MSDVAQKKTSKKVLSDSKKAWLCQMVGGQILFTPDCGFVAKDDDGNPIDLQALQEEVANAPDSEDSFGIDFDITEKKAILARYGIPSIADAATEFREGAAKKEKRLQDVRNLIELQKEEIRSSMDYDMQVKRRIEIGGKEILFGSKTVSTKEKKSEKSFDPEHYKNRVIEGPTPQQSKAIQEVIDQLTLLTQKLQNDEEIDFTPQELMNELWTPMVREGLISEPQCPDEFSRVLQLFRGASTLYNKRLEATARKPIDKHENIRDHLGDLSTVLGIGAGAADIVLSVVGVGGNAQKIVAIATKCTQSAIKSTSALLQMEADFQTAGAGVAEILGSVLEASIGGDKGKSIGSLAKTAFNGCVSLGLLGKKFAQREYDSAFDMLADAVGAALSCIGDATENKKITAVANSASSALQGAYRSGQLVYLLNQQPVDMTAVKKLLAQITEKAIKLSIRNSLDNTTMKAERQQIKDQMVGLEEDSDAYKQWEKKLSDLEDKQSKMLDGLDKVFEGVVSDDGAIMMELTKKVEQKALEKGAEASDQELAEGREQFGKQLAAAFNMSVGVDEGDSEFVDELYSIDALIAQIEKDRATLEIFNLIFDSAGAVITTFIPQLGGPLKAKAFAMNVVAAAERSFDLMNFVNLVSDARKAGSPQVATLLAEVDELKRHLTNDTIEAAIAFGQAVSLSAAAIGDLASGAMGTGAVVGVVGRAVSSSLDAFKQSKDLLKKKFEDKKTAKAWEMYKKAIDNPRDRNHILKTFRTNPTLAKYGIAYGAIEMDDPIAREALRQIGLNDVVLAQESSSVDKVVMYLEAKFSDDIKVEGVLSRFAPDVGEPLTLAVWIKNKETAAHPENPESGRWKTEKTVAIDTAMREVELSADEILKKDLAKIFKPSQWNEFLPSWQSHISNLEKLVEALSAFKPLTTQDLPFEQFQSYLSELVSVARKYVNETKSKITIQQSILTSQKKSFENIVSSGEACVSAIAVAIPKFGSPEGRTPSDLYDNVLTKGVAADLLKSLQDNTGTTPKIVTHVDFFQHALSTGIRKCERALKSTDDQTNKALTADIVRCLIADATSCREAMRMEVAAAQNEILQFPVFDK
ncbi:hypothetical protein SH467x_002069 [Pirellulaceae bacterium SH467]